jgi:hypothetical protein
MNKGLIMSVIAVSIFIVVCYFCIYKFTNMNPGKVDPNRVPEQIKDEINDYFGQRVASEVIMDFVGYSPESNEDGSFPSPTYMLTAKVKIGDQETCLHSLMEDTTPISIHLATNYFIQKITNFKKGLQITC